MGQKVHPTGVRVGIIKDWNSKWYADSKNFSDYLVEDQKIRKFLKKKLYAAGVSKIEIERTAKAVKVNLYTAKPGIVIGKGGAGAESTKAELAKLIGKDVNLNIVEVKSADTDAQLVAENIAGQLERRISFRRAMKQCMQKATKAGALGIKTAVSGRLGGADMARTEFYKEGNIPLQTLRADIDYDAKNEQTREFFKTVQNKMHYAVHGNTAAEVIFNRVDSKKENIGLTNFKGNMPTRAETEIAKNYLSEKELDLLNRMVSAYLDVAEINALNMHAMTMKDWVKELDGFLTMTHKDILEGAGTISHEKALEKAHKEYDKYMRNHLTQAEKDYLEIMGEDIKKLK